MAITNFMNLDLPVVTTTLGPEWATKLNTALTAVDEHNHTSGKGTKVPTAGLNVNADLSFNSNRASSLLSSKYTSQVSSLSGATNANSVYVVSGDLYYTNSSGTAVQLTTGNSIVSSPATFETLNFTSINSNLTILPADTFVFIAVDTSASRTITLPLASSVAEGRVYAIKDSTGSANANPIVVDRQGSDLIDGESSYNFDSNYGAVWLITDGISNWYRL
jgi:hypothetical protein